MAMMVGKFAREPRINNIQAMGKHLSTGTGISGPINYSVQERAIAITVDFYH
jgi:hypothetical protein